MEFQKLVNLLDTTSDDKNSPRFITKKWTEFNDQSKENYEQRNLNPMLKSDLCDFSDAYIVVNRTITVARKIFVTNDFMDLAQNGRAAAATTSNTANDAALDGKMAFKNNTLFIN